MQILFSTAIHTLYSSYCQDKLLMLLASFNLFTIFWDDSVCEEFLMGTEVYITSHNAYSAS